MIEQNDKREAAIKRLRAKRGFKIHVAIYLVVNALIVVVWASSGAGLPGPNPVTTRAGMPANRQRRVVAEIGRAHV